MTTYVSTAVTGQDGKTGFQVLRRLTLNNDTQARKSASRIWTEFAHENGLDLLQILVARKHGDRVIVSERQADNRKWNEYVAVKGRRMIDQIIKALGNHEKTPMPDEINVNGVIYIRKS